MEEENIKSHKNRPTPKETMKNINDFVGLLALLVNHRPTDRLIYHTKRKIIPTKIIKYINEHDYIHDSPDTPV